MRGSMMKMQAKAITDAINREGRLETSENYSYVLHRNGSGFGPAGLSYMSSGTYHTDYLFFSL